MYGRSGLGAVNYYTGPTTGPIPPGANASAVIAAEANLGPSGSGLVPPMLGSPEANALIAMQLLDPVTGQFTAAAKTLTQTTYANLLNNVIGASGGATVIQQNITSPGSPNFMVGDQFQVVISGAPNATVTMTGYLNGTLVHPTSSVGTTDATGKLLIPGVTQAGAVGYHQQTWMVGTQSVTVTFTVVAPATPVTPPPVGSTNATGQSAGGAGQGPVNTYSGPPPSTTPPPGSSTNASGQTGSLPGTGSGTSGAGTSTTTPDMTTILIIGGLALGALVLLGNIGKR